MKLGILGAGRVGTHLCHAFVGVGHEVTIWNRSLASANQLASETGCSVAETMGDLPMDADAYLICVKDDAIDTVADDFSRIFGERKGVVAHTAGSKPLSVLKDKFPRVGVLYPMQTFSKEKSLDYSKIPFFVEENDEDGNILKPLASSVSNHVYNLNSEQRRFLHLASVFACNFSNYCYTLASDILGRIGVPFSVLLPLIQETAQKVSHIPPRQAQTGPAARGDISVVQCQAHLLDYDKDLQRIYELMSRSIMNANGHCLNDSTCNTNNPARTFNEETRTFNNSARTCVNSSTHLANQSPKQK